MLERSESRLCRSSRRGGNSEGIGEALFSPSSILLQDIASREVTKGFQRFHGGIAQLGERVLGVDEVGGSNPPASTR